jgi:PAS domain S-box-containing protein
MKASDLEMQAGPMVDRVGAGVAARAQPRHYANPFQFRRRWNALPLRSKGLSVIAIPLVPLLVSTVFVLIIARQGRLAEDLVSHTLEVKSSVANTLNLVIDGETGVRGFLLTHDPAWLGPYERAASQLPDAMRQLMSLTIDNPVQVRHFGVVTALVGARPLAALVAWARSDDTRTTPLELLTQNRALTVSLRQELGAMQQEEDRLLVERAEIARSARVRLLAVTIGGALLGLLGGTLAASAFTAGVTLRLDEVSRNADRLARGEQPDSVTAADDEVGHLTTRLAEAGALMAGRVHELEETRAELDRFFSMSLDMLCIADLEGRFKRVNPAFGVTLGWSADELTAVPYLNFVHPDDREAVLAETAKLAAGETTLTFEARYRCKDGSYRWLNWRALPLPDRGLIYATARDVTERKKSLADLEVANRELEAFSYSVSHDLRAPLRHITGFASLLQRHAGATLDSEGSRYMTTIVDAASRMGRLIDDLLEFSRMGRAQLVKRSVSLGDLVRAAQQDAAATVPGRTIAWTIHPLPDVEGDAAMLRQVVVNLVSNAVKYTATRTHAEIEIGANGHAPGETVVFVRDNGVGFDMQYVHKLFGVFQRLHSSDEFEGTGIGLANVRRIIHRHGGRTWAEGSLDAGATFFFALPTEPGGAA